MTIHHLPFSSPQDAVAWARDHMMYADYLGEECSSDRYLWAGSKDKSNFERIVTYGSYRREVLDPLKDVIDSPVTCGDVCRGEMEYSEFGDDFDANLYFAGEVECMMSRPLVEVPGKTLKVLISTGVNGNTAVKDIIESGVLILRALNDLAMKGFSIRIDAGYIARVSSYHYYVSTVRIKDEYDPFDISILGMAFAEPAFTRGILLGNAERLDLSGINSSVVTYKRATDLLAKVCEEEDVVLLRLCDMVPYCEDEQMAYLLEHLGVNRDE